MSCARWSCRWPRGRLSVSFLAGLRPFAARPIPLKSRSSLPPPPDLPSFRIEDEEPAGESPEERHRDTGLVRHSVALSEGKIDADAAKVVRRLERSGFQAYLVGGCVRDLLLGGRPKDFDVATSARPDDVKSIFRNCRIIGRRFRLAHVLFAGGKVVEVATFRRNPQAIDEDVDETLDLLIRNDNSFGDAHEDAIRRDFTINALFYDLDRGQVLDWCGGMEHLLSRSIQTIGDPNVRFREDPVRMLRAIKFAARLDLGLAPSVYDSIVSNRFELDRAAKPRLFEEISRLMRGGAAHRSVWLSWELGVLSVLMPELAAYLDDEGYEGVMSPIFRHLTSLDQLIKQREKVDDLLLWSVLLHEPLREVTHGERDITGAVLDFLDPIVAKIAMPRRIADGIARIETILPRLRSGRVAKVARSEVAGIAVDVLEVERIAAGERVDDLDTMRSAVKEQSARREQDRMRFVRSRTTPRRG